MRPRTPPQRLLIVLMGAIGDVTLGLPLAQRLRAAWPSTHVIWAVEPPAAPLVQGHPAVDEVIVFARRGGAGMFPRFLRAVRASRPGMALDLQRHFKSGLTSWYSRAPVRVGCHWRNSREGNWFFNTHHVPPVERFTPKIGHFLRFADYLGVPAAPISFGLAPTAAERARAADMLGRVGGHFAAVYVGATWPSRRWLAGSTAALCRGLQVRGLSVVILGGRADVAFADSVLAAQPGDVLNLAGRTTLRDVVAILDRAAVAIGPDTGLMHIAAALETPVISLFGPTSPARSAPYGSEPLVVRGDMPCAPCYVRRCPIGQLCMHAVTPEAVLSRVEEVVAGSWAKSGSARGKGGARPTQLGSEDRDEDSSRGSGLG